MAGQSDWRDDETLSARIRAMRRGQRHQAAYLALRRLQAPLILLEMPQGWGVDPAAVDALLRSGETHLDGDVNEDLQQAIAELSAAPLFESEIEPEFAESFQLEAISGWLMLAEALGEMTEVQTETVIYLARELADYLDRYMESSLTVVEGEAIHERYLAGIDDRLRSYGLDYFGSRNLEVEGVCHKAILAAPEGEDVLSSAEGHELLNACDEYSRQILSALQAFPVD
ncbi:hypothetical protein N8I84_17080 [Streptomyces cynarae]|uniref:Uncharacterized protein n=1 Tax=Streptomyces cynarae TaxID=2981134 RepID=A0ABY6E1W2_9ACTN|nr:hypothetical protein [Streptomyces cynarae]UXY20237.1 hypothetical protein N8I84_17080 [Streptomyces cynarae]